MKRFAAILVFIIYLLGATDANQLMKIPFMVNHFNGHHQENPAMNIAGFIYMHYINPVIDDDHEQDMQLPFKQHNQDGCMISAISMPIQKWDVVIHAVPITPLVYSTIQHTRYSFQHMVNIFQPPRLV